MTGATDDRATWSAERLDTLVTVLDLVRGGRARTRPELAELSGLGRGVIAERVAELIDRGLVEDGGIGRSTGGRAPRELRFRADAGVILVAPLGVTAVGVGVTDLAGRVLVQRVEPCDIAAGPDDVLGHVEEILGQLLQSDAVPDGVDVYGVGVGLPGPVEFATGRPVSPPIMPGWDLYPVRERLAERFRAPVWVDNDVNLMALGELRAGVAQGEANVVFVKIGTGIGAGLVASGKLHRGAQGCAGDIGHVLVAEDTGIVCRCGNVGCLEALAGGAALARDAAVAAMEGRSPYLKALLDRGRPLEASDVGDAAQHGDAAAVGLLLHSGRLVGETLATLVNAFNPSLIILGGGVLESGDAVVAAISQTVYRRSLPLATRELRIRRSSLTREGALIGAAHMVVDQLFSSECLGLWLADGSPAGHTKLPAQT